MFKVKEEIKINPFSFVPVPNKQELEEIWEELLQQKRGDK